MSNLENLSATFFAITFLFYALSFLAYTSMLVSASKREVMKSIALLLVLLGFSAHTLGLATRWVAAGFAHPPLTNMYESMQLFLWGIVLVHLYLIKKYRVHVSGIFTMMIVIVGMGLASLNPVKGIEPLVPALQSYWLHLHVFMASISYAFFLASAVFALLYTIKHQEKGVLTGIIFDGFAAFCLMVGTASSLFLLRPLQFTRVEVVYSKIVHTQEMIEIPYVHVLLLILAILFVLTLFLHWRRHALALKLSIATSLLYLLLLLWICQALMNTEGLSLASNPYKLGLLVLGLFTSLTHRLLSLNFVRFREMLPSEELLDQLSYKAVLISLPLLTLVVVTGSVWAHYAWGRYWGWDPKETWSLITWFIYALYLHLRLQKGWRGQKSAFISLLGFLAVIFTYLGVNILLSGLHSYG
ncbi:MAG: cytochrome c biogenesis protein CcsA [Oligoflexia bacterium]|nr:cytochrome c biogenesis protein CcsA [Oligoflexia bacterium]MBF0365259.1 cytochrome c biogenesis protein CcsA [Oligoflexia bacterium]